MYLNVTVWMLVGEFGNNEHLKMSAMDSITCHDFGVSGNTIERCSFLGGTPKLSVCPHAGVVAFDHPL